MVLLQKVAALCLACLPAIAQSGLPLIGSQYPAPNAANVPLNSSIVVRLNFPAASVQGVLRKTGLTADLPVTLGPFPYSNGQIMGDIPWRINNALEPNTTYEFTVTVPGLSSTFRFTTGADFDTKPPQLVSVSPSTANGPIDDPFAPFQFVFDEPLLTASIPVLLADGDGQTLPNRTSVSLSDDRTVLSVHLLSGPIPPILQISLASNGILDLSGNAFGPVPIQRRWTIAQAGANLRLVGQYPRPGDTNVPTNVALILLFNRPVNASALVQGLVLETDAGPVSINNTSEYANSIALFAVLLPNTTYRVHLTTQVRGYDGSVLASPVDWTFTTGGDPARIDNGNVSVFSPNPQIAPAPTNTLFVARFANPLPAFTLRMFDTPGALTIKGTPVPISATLTADQRTLVLTPAAPLPPNSQYALLSPEIFDIYGRAQTIQTSGKIGGGADSAGPNVIASSPSDGMQNVPIDVRIRVVFDETLGANTPADALQLSTAAGLTVNGTTNLAPTTASMNFSGATIDFIPQTKLQPDTSYTLAVSGARDWAGNAGPSKSISFRTGAATVPTPPFPNLIRNNFSGKEIDPQLPVELEYDQPLSAAYVYLTVDFSIPQPFSTTQFFAIPIRVEITGGLVRATPLAAWPSGRVMTLSFQATDLTGRALSFSGVFRGGASTDTTQARVTSVTPPAGTPLGPDDSIIVTFSKPMLDASGLEGGLWYSDSVDRRFPDSAKWSADRRSVTLRQGIPNYQNITPTMISLAISTALKDFAGNPAIPATFTWPIGTLVSAPPAGGTAGITASWPPQQDNSLIGQNPIVLLLDRMGDEAVFNRSVLVMSAEQGKVNGAWRQDGLTMSFTPDSPWPSATTISLLVFNNVLGIPIGFSRSTANPQPAVAGLPRPLNTSVPLINSFPTDGALEVQFDQDPTPGAVTLYTGAQHFMGPVSYTEKKVRPGVVQYTPRFPLKAGEYVQIFATSASVTVRSNSALIGPATTGPANLLSKTPDAGAEQVPRNAFFSIRYDAAINPLTVGSAVTAVSNGHTIPIQYISANFSSSDLAFRPLTPLPANSVVNVRVDGLEDLAGRSLPGLSWSFSTSAAFDFSIPQTIGSSATLGQTGAPLVRLDPFLPVSVSFNEPLDPVRTAAAITYQRNQTLNVIFSDDLRTLTIRPPEVGWRRGETYIFDGLAAVDWSGNRTASFTVYFTVVFDADPQPPVTTGVSPADGDTGVPVNTLIGIALNQPANGDVQQEVYLTHGDVRTPLTTTAYSNSSHVLLMPTVLLEPNTQYQLHIGPIGTGAPSSSTPVTQTFTTGGSVESAAPVVTYQYGSLTDPIRVRFSGVMDITRTPTTVLTTVDFYGYSKPIPAQINWSSDRQTLTITPNDPMQAGTSYAISLNSLTGRGGVGNGGYSTNFVLSNGPPQAPTIPAVTFLPADGSTGVPTNSRIQVSINVNPVTAPAIRLFEDGVEIVIPNSGPKGYPLLASRKYRIETDAFVDTRGRTIAAASSSFTTAAGPNTSPLQLLSINPSNNAAGVALDAPVELTFSSLLNPFSTPATLPQSSHAFPFRLTYEIAGPVFRAKPDPGWPSASTIVWLLSALNGTSITGLAGNQLTQQITTTFRTVAANDPEPPVLVSVSPAAGTLLPGGQNTIITLQFSKPIVVPSDGLQIFSGSQAVPNSSPIYSSDYTALLIPVMPAAQSQITLIGSASIQDNAENPLEPFVIQFPTGDVLPRGGPVGNLLQPRNFAINVPATTDILIGFDRAMDIVSTLAGIRVTQNGQNVSGALSTPDGGKTFNFHPDQPFDAAAAVHVFLLNSIQDANGYLLAPSNNPYFSFTIAGTAGSSGGVLRISKRGFGASVPADAILEVEFSEDLDPGSVRDDSVWLRYGNELVSGTPTLRDGRVLRFTPSHPLVPGEEYVLTAGAALKTLDGRLFAGRNFAGQDLHLRATVPASGPEPEIESIETVELQGRAALHVRMTGPLSPLAARSMKLLASESGQDVPAEVLSGIDGRDWWIVPAAARSGAFTISLEGAVSLSGRQLSAGRREVRIK